MTSKMDMFLCGLVLTLMLAADQCGAQYPSYSTLSASCTLLCSPSEGYAVRMGQTMCMCRNDLCKGNYCGTRGCVVMRLPFYGDWMTCGAEPSPVPVVNSRVETVPVTTGTTSTRCNEPRVTGRCRALIVRYYYDPESGLCKEFAFGGCDANQNNFSTMEECQNTCMSARARLPAVNSSSNNNNENSNNNASNNNNDTSNNNASTNDNDGSNSNSGSGQVDVRTAAQAAQFLLQTLYRNAGLGK